MKKKSILSSLIIVYCVISACNCFAVTTNRRAITWNMQGANEQGTNGSQSKWTTVIPQMLSPYGGNAEILALQEPGGPLTNAIPPPAAGAPAISGPGAATVPVQEFQLNFGTERRPKIFYIYYWDYSQRTNLAIISRSRAEEIIVFPTLLSGRRPVIGIRIGDDYFFNLHAGAHRNNEAPAQVIAIEQYMANIINGTPRTAANPNANWMIMGDFNREPVDLENHLPVPPPGTQRRIIYNGRSATQTSGRELDYAVAGGATVPGGGPAFLSVATLMNHMSDHVGVRFAPASSLINETELRISLY